MAPTGGVLHRFARRYFPRRRRHRHLAVLFVVILVVLAAVLVATGHPPKHCTWQQTDLGKGAFTRECVPNRVDR